MHTRVSRQEDGAAVPTDAEDDLDPYISHAGRDLRPEGFEIPLSLLAEAAEISGNVLLGPPR